MPIDENIKRNISISPKINGISFFNMIRYALLLPNLKPENLELSIGNNYYDILVRFLLDELERILQRDFILAIGIIMKALHICVQKILPNLKTNALIL